MPFVYIYISIGQTDVPLSNVGEKQAELVATRLQNDRFSHIFASDLTRAYDTAKIIAQANKVCRCDITVDKRLRERVWTFFIFY